MTISNTFEHYYISEQYYVLHLDIYNLPFICNSGREMQHKLKKQSLILHADASRCAKLLVKKLMGQSRVAWKEKGCNIIEDLGQ